MVALIFDIGVLLEGIWATKDISDDGVIDDQLCRCKRIYLCRIAAEIYNRFAHRGEINYAGHAREILHDHARWRELNFGIGYGAWIPLRERCDLLGGDVGAIFVAK